MPDLTGNIEEIQNSLKASLGRGQNLDQNVVAASKRVLLRSIDFKPASAPLSLQCNALKAKYTLLNPSAKTTPWNGTADHQQGKKDMHKSAMEGGNEESLPRPKVVLYPEELLKMEWTSKTPCRIGAGLVNMGNTCFFNSTLQCLTYTAPLVNYCMSEDHRKKCKKNGFCMMCEIQSHIRNSLGCGGRSIKPHSMLQKLRCIAKHMKWGRQEDAHEFLRFVVDHLQQSCLAGESKLDSLSKETTVINQIFGGYLRSQVTCLRCQAKSNTFDPFMDLSLDIKGVNTVEDALTKFVKPETLENENAYKCPKCRHKVRAHKRFSIQKPPNILTLQLNRFDFHRHLSGKINRFIKYPERINIRNFMSQRQGEPILYHLYGVLVHSGHSSDCGHYYSYVKSPSKTWYCMNDSMVHQASNQSVFSADAYVLFYARVNRSIPITSTPKMDSVKSPLNHPKQNSFIGPVLPGHKTQVKSPMTNGIHGKPSNDIGTPISRDQKNLPNMPKIVPNALSLPGSHKKISFPILTSQQKKLQQQDKNDKDDEDHVVLHIKYGNSTTMLKSPDGKSKVVNGNISTLPWNQNKSGLVPYNDDSDSEQENESSQLTPSLKMINSSASLMKRLSDDRHSTQSSGDNNLSVKTPSAHKNGSVPLVNGAGDNMASHKTPFEKKHLTSPSKTPFVWESSPSPPCTISTSECRSNGQHLPSASPSTSNGLHKCQPSDGKHKSFSSPPQSSSNLTLPSKQSGSKPHLSLELPNSSASKVKSCGGTWHIYPHEGAPSPRGSNSSSNSVNSTSEWMVESKGGNVKPFKDIRDISQSLFLNFSTEDKTNNKKQLVPTTTDSPPSSSKPKTMSTSNKSRCLSQTPVSESKYHSKYFTHNGSMTPVDIRDKQPLLSPTSSQSSESSKKVDKLSKSRKRKLENNSRDSSPSQSEDDGSNKTSLKKRKKKLKHRKDKEDRKRLISDSDSEDSDSVVKTKSKKNKKNHKKRQRSDSDSSPSSTDKMSKRKAKSKSDKHRQQSSRNSEGNSSSSTEEVYEWVEKTIESPLTNGKAHQVLSQSWDHHVKNDLHRKKEGDEVKPAKMMTWDGARHSKVSKELENNLDYKNQVKSWDGGKSQLSRDLEESRKTHRMQETTDDYDQELDAGRVKKVKNRKDDTTHKPSHNPFQQFNNFKNKSCEENGETSWSRDHSYFDRRDEDGGHYNGNNNGSHRTDSYHSKHSWQDNKPYKSFNNYNGGKVSATGKYFK